MNSWGDSPTRTGSGRWVPMPDTHALRFEDMPESSIDQLQRAYEYQPADFAEFVGLDGIGAGSLRALVLVAQVLPGAAQSRSDSAKYASAHGRKDGTPQPVDRERQNRTIDALWRTHQSVETDHEVRQGAIDPLVQLPDTETTRGSGYPR